MFTYRLVFYKSSTLTSVNRSDGWAIPIATDNTDYQNFKAQILADEAQLEDVDGNVMSPKVAKDYVRTLP